MSQDKPQRDGESRELDDVFQEFLLLADSPDADILESMVAKYPGYASELTDFAVEWAVQDLMPGEDGYGGEPATGTSSAVAKAMDRLHAELDADGPRRSWADPFKDRSPAELQGLAAALGLDKTLVAKLRDRRIDAETVPRGLCEGLAGELEVPLDAVIAHLNGPPVLTAGASFKASDKPEAVGKEPFARAVEGSQLGPEDKKRLLDLD